MVNSTVPPARLLLAFWTVATSVTSSPDSTRFVGAWRLVTVGSFCVAGRDRHGLREPRCWR